MAHDLFGDRMAYVGEVPWHGLGERVPETVTSAAMCKAAGLDWTVNKVPAPGARLVNQEKKLHDRYLIMRSRVGDETDDVALGMVGSGYEPLQNAEAFAFFEPFITGKFARFNTAGALGNGQRVWVLAKLTGEIVVRPDDVIDRYLLLSNSHDGSGSVSVRFTPIRVVCKNTLSFAMPHSSGVISVRHTRHVARNLADAQAKELKLIVEKAFSEAGTLYGAMALKAMTVETTDAFLQNLFPKSKKQQRAGTQPERWHRVKAILADASVTPPSTRSTLWALYNAIVRDEDYRVSREGPADARLNRVWFGSGEDLKLKALSLSRQQLKKAA